MSNSHDKSPILVPIDFSSHSEEALVFAMKLAGFQSAPVVVLHVVHDPGEAPGFYAGNTGEGGVERMEDVAEKMMAGFMENFTTRHPECGSIRDTSTMLRVGLPVTRILEVVDAINAEMVVMGSLGRTGLKHMLIGSKAEQLVRLCPVPITIVKHNANE
ncbi:universal stress protein [Gammaproteobacteria bacterium]|jgi:nucleotide-binding universal stress UspA family protein|nr:universal stress protein [Gammaproteobacteria bacterium]